MTSEPDNSQKSFGQKAKEALGGLAANAQAAARLAAKQAERAKLANVTLPHAYRELGKDIHAAGRYRDQFPDEFAKADELRGRIEALRQAAPEKEGESKTFTDRAKDAAGKARDAALAKKLDGDLNSAWRKLGHAAFTKLGADSGSPDLVGPIEECRQRLATLDAEIQAIDGAASGVLTPRRLLVGAGACIVVVLAFGAWAMFGGTKRDSEIAAKAPRGLRSAQVPVTEQIPTDVPAFSDLVRDARSSLADTTPPVTEQVDESSTQDMTPEERRAYIAFIEDKEKRRLIASSRLLQLELQRFTEEHISNATLRDIQQLHDELNKEMDIKKKLYAVALFSTRSGGEPLFLGV